MSELEKKWVYPAALEAGGGSRRRRGDKALVHVPTGEAVASLAALDRRLLELGWERYYDNPKQRLAQFCRPGTADLLSVPRHFSYLTAAHMRDVVDMNEGHFEVVDSPPLPEEDHHHGIIGCISQLLMTWCSPRSSESDIWRACSACP